jgi:hypothetical protein
VPALISAALFVAAYATLVVFADDLAAWVTPFADGWSSGPRQVVRLLAESAFLGAGALVAVLTFTAGRRAVLPARAAAGGARQAQPPGRDAGRYRKQLLGGMRQPRDVQATGLDCHLRLAAGQRGGEQLLRRLLVGVDEHEPAGVLGLGAAQQPQTGAAVRSARLRSP